MITTVTTTTTTSLIGATSLALVAIGTLLVLLVKKELISSSQGEWAVRLEQVINVAIVPLLMVFGITVVARILSEIS